MRRILLLLLAMLCTAVLAYSEDTSQSKGTAMTGWLCNSKCVKPSGSKNTCDKTCTATDGDTVFISSQGAVEKISNQEMVKSHSSKKVKMMASMNKDSHMLEVYNVVQEYAGP